MKKEIKNVKILEKTVGPDKAQILKRLGFAPRSQSFAFVASPQYAQSVRYPDSLLLRPSANPQVQHDMGWLRCLIGALAPDKVFSLFTSHFSQRSAFTSHLSPTHFSRRAASRIIRVVAGVTSRSTSRVGFAIAHTAPYRKFGFTLAEVLITLGIIGVVAMLVMPQLIQNYRKRVVETKLVKIFSLMNQAIKRAEVDFGPKKDWTYEGGEGGGVSDQTEWIQKYWAPYMKIVKIDTSSGRKHPLIYFPDGSTLYCVNGTSVYVWIYSVHGDARKYLDTKYSYYADGKNTFSFMYIPDVTGYDRVKLPPNDGITREGFIPTTQGWDGTREGLFENSIYKYVGVFCRKDGGNFCTALIEDNGWKIPDDYPIKF